MLNLGPPLYGWFMLCFYFDYFADPLLRTSSCDLRFALASIKKARKQRCALDVRLDTWDANVSDQQLHNLREIVVGFRSKAVQEGVEDASGITSKPEQGKGNEVNNVPDKPGRRSWFDYSSEDSEEEGDPGESGTEGRAAFPGLVKSHEEFTLFLLNPKSLV